MSNQPSLRHLVHSSALGLVLVLAPWPCLAADTSAADAQPPAVSVPAPHTIKLGDFECAVLYDMTARYNPEDAFVNAPKDELAAALACAGISGPKLVSPYEGFLVRTGRNVVLIDTGAGPSDDPAKGRLFESLARVGVAPEAIDAVLLTHGHLDHIGGTLGPDGRPAFPNARYVMFRREWDFWMQDSPDLSALQIGEELKKLFVDLAHAKLGPLHDRVELIEGDTEVCPGITALFAGGHTPGHMVVQITSRGERLLYISDLVLNPIALEHPGWHSRYECDVAGSRATMRRVIGRAAADGVLVHAMHFPYPGLGHIAAEDNHWMWRPLVGEISSR